jgi:glycosyltransferase involved in cell wall biosynthesis
MTLILPMPDIAQFPPRVSIITPSYNQAEFLEAAIQSVLAQAYPNLEYIIMDGGSTDGSVEIIERYAGQISYWRSQQDKGQADAINNGFERATGKYIAWLNSDDLYLPGCIQKAVEILEADAQLGMAFGQVEVINRHGMHLGFFRPASLRFDDLLCVKTIIPQQAAFFRREYLAEIGILNPHLHFALDHELFLRIAFRHPIAGFPAVVAQYRLSENNKGAKQRSMWSYEFIRILDDFFAQPDLKAEAKLLFDRAYAGAYYRGACNFLDDEQYNQSRDWFLKAVQHQKIYLFYVSWWRNFLRTFLGTDGNALYNQAKLMLARAGILNIDYDWWTALRKAVADYSDGS